MRNLIGICVNYATLFIVIHTKSCQDVTEKNLNLTFFV